MFIKFYTYLDAALAVIICDASDIYKYFVDKATTPIRNTYSELKIL